MIREANSSALMVCLASIGVIFLSCGGNLKYSRATLQEQCERGDAEGCSGLAVMHYEGEAGPRDKSAARALFEKACDLGLTKACFYLGRMLYFGEGGPQDLAKARILFTNGCDASTIGYVMPEGCLEEFWNLANASIDDKPSDYSETRAQLDQHDARCSAMYASEGCNQLGHMLRNGEGGPQDRAEARTRFELACDKGYSEGCNNLGHMLRNGEGGPQDLVGAFAAYNEACNAVASDYGYQVMGGFTYPKACRNLAIMLAKGWGISQDIRSARNLLKGACDRGEELSCDALHALTGE